MATKYELVNILRESNAHLAKFTDEEIWQMARAESGIEDLPVWETEIKVEESDDDLHRNIPESQQSVNNIDVTPDSVSALKKSIGAYATYGGLSEEMLGEGVTGKYGKMVSDALGIPEHYWKETYNTQSANFIHQMMFGESKYQVEDYDYGFLGEAGQFLLGLIEPASVITFGTAGKVGQKGAELGQYLIGRKFMQDGLESLAKKSLGRRQFAQRAIVGAHQRAGDLGTFMAIHGGMMEGGRQGIAIKNGEMEGFDVGGIIKEAGKHGLEGAAIGGVIGVGLDGGLGTLYGRKVLKQARGEELALREKITKGMQHPIPRTAYEGAVFQLSGNVFQQEGAPPINSREWWLGVVQNTLNFGGLKLFGHMMNRGGEKMKDKEGRNIGMDATIIATNELQRVIKGFQEEAKSMDNVIKGAAEAGVELKDMQSLVDKAQQKAFTIQYNQEELTKDIPNWERFKDITNRIVKGEIPEEAAKRTPEQTADLVWANQHGLPLMLKYKGVLEGLKNNKEQFYTILEDIRKKPLSDKEKEQADVWLNIHDGLIQQGFESMNEAMIPLSFTNEALANKPSADAVLVKYNGLVDATGKPVMKWMSPQEASGLEALGIVTPAGAKPAEGAPAGARILVPGEAVSSIEAGILGTIKETIKKGLPETPEGKLDKKKEVLFGATTETKEKGLLDLVNMPSKTTKGKELERKGKDGNTVNDMLAGLNLDKEQYEIALLGIEEFSSKSKANSNPAQYKRLFDYWSWLKERGVKIEDARRELTEKYLEGKEIRQGDRDFQVINDAISAFYGGKDAKIDGFMDKYVSGAPNVFAKGLREVGAAKETARGVPAPREQVTIQGRLDKLVKEKAEHLGIDTKASSGALELLIETGARPSELAELKVENIDWDGGQILKWYSPKKKKTRFNIPIKEVLPHLWERMLEAKGNRTTGELFLDLSNKGLSTQGNQTKLRKILKDFTKDLPLVGEKGYSTLYDFRRAVETDLKRYVAETKDVLAKTFFDENLTARKQGTSERYVSVDKIDAWNRFKAWREKKAGVKVPVVKEKQVPTKEQKLGIVEGKPFETVAGMHDFVNKHLKNNPGLKIFVSGDKKNLEIAGSYLGGVVNLFHGKANMHTFFHENAHRHKEMVHATKDKDFIKLWEKGEKLAVEWAKKNDTKWSYFERKYGKDAAEEYLANKIADVSTKFEKGGFGKLGQWFKTFFSQFKKVFLPKNLKQQDIANILGKKVQKGFEYTPATMKPEWLEQGKSYDVAGLGVAKIVGQMTRGGKDLFKFQYMENGKTVEKWKSADFLEGRRIVPSKGKKLGDTYLAIDEKGNVIEVVGERPKFQFADTGEYVDNINKLLKATLKKYGISETEKLEVISSIARLAGLEDDFKISSKSEQADLVTFYDKISDLPVHSLNKNVEVAQWLKNYSTVEKTRVKANIGEKHQKEVLELMGVPEGNVYRASVDQLKQYQALIHTMHYEERRPDSWVEDGQRFDFLDKETKELLMTFPGWKQAFIPLHLVYKGMGLKNLSNKLLQHVSIELHHVGRWVTFEDKAKEIVGKKNFGKWSNHFYLLDRKRYLERKQNNMLDKKEIKFINNAMSKEWINGKSGDPRNMINSKTKEGKLVIEYYKFTDYFPKMLEKVLAIQMNPAELEKWKKENNVKWIKDNFYVSRVLSKEFRKKYNPRGRHFEKLVNSEAEKEAIRLVEEQHGKKYTPEQYGDALEHARQVKWAEIGDMFTFAPGRYSSRFLQKRHAKLPEVVKLDGKNVNVYETAYDRTVTVYGQGMSKFLANIEAFPEFVNLKGFKSYGADAMLGKIEAAHGQRGSFIRETLHNHLGINRTINTEMGDVIMSASRYYSTVLAKVGLSFPTAGLKNFLLGSTSTVTSMDVLDFTRGLIDSMDRENRQSVRRTGQTELGMRHFEELPSIKKLDKLFRFGLMKPFENINRYIAVLAGRHDQGKIVKILQTHKPGTKKYDRAVNRMKKFYNLTDKQIELLKKHGLDDPIIMQKMEALNREELAEQRAIQNTYEQLDTYAAINTQGSSQDIFMPYWTTGYVKPHTLYKRMAYAATVNTFRNLNEAWENKNITKFINYGVGTYISGTVLDAIRWNFLGTPSPETNSAWWRRGAAIAVKGELFGILSEFGKLAYDGSNITWQMYPATYLHMGKTFEYLSSLTDIVTLPKTHPLMKLKLSIRETDNYLKQTVSLWGQTKKLIENATSPYNKNHNQFRMLAREFYQEKGIERPSAIMKHENSPYWELFKSGWNNYYMKGKTEEWNKVFSTVFYGTANNYLWKGATEDGIRIRDYRDAYKQAAKNIEAKIKALNPNTLSVLTKSEYKKWMGLKYRVWLDSRGKNLTKDVDKLEKQYLYYWRNWWYKDFKKFLNDYNMKDDKQYFTL